jgi:phosphoglycolate phosphatase-like HAD superfamily hydrolase
MLTLLFDIDGTLIRSGGAGKAALEGALAEVFSLTRVQDGVPYSGRTDVAISMDLLRLHAIEPTNANLQKLSDAYLERLGPCLIERGGTILPGVHEILTRYAGQAHIGLLTGNVRRGAEIKLRHFGLWDYFRFGGFGDGYTQRDDVARMAIVNARRHADRDLDPEHVWVVGDTPHDITCARAVRARAIAVCTGWHDELELAEYQPDILVRDLTHDGDIHKAWSQGLVE